MDFIEISSSRAFPERSGYVVYVLSSSFIAHEVVLVVFLFFGTT